MSDRKRSALPLRSGSGLGTPRTYWACGTTESFGSCGRRRSPTESKALRAPATFRKRTGNAPHVQGVRDDGVASLRHSLFSSSRWHPTRVAPASTCRTFRIYGRNFRTTAPFLLAAQPLIPNTKNPQAVRPTGLTKQKIGCRGWIRTNDLQVMSLTSYRAAPPCNKWDGQTITAARALSTAFFKKVRFSACQPSHRSLFSAPPSPIPGGGKTNHTHLSIARRPSGRPVFQADNIDQLP